MAAVGCTLVILVATLSPEPETLATGTILSWYGFDVAQNLLLFAPLGAALFLATRSHAKSFLLGAALSLAVELLQLHAIRGRDASLADWIANALGTLGGAGLAAMSDAVLRRMRS